KTYCGRFTVEVWEESPDSPVLGCSTIIGDLREKEPADVIYSMSTQFQNDPLGFVVRGDPNNLQDLRFSTINNDPQLNVTINPVMLTTKTVRVGIKALDNLCPTAANAFPVMVTDQTRTSDNFLYGYIPNLCPLPMKHYLWRDMQPWFNATTGDFVIRLILKDPTYMGGGDADVGPDVGPDVGYDVGPDVGYDAGNDELDAGHEDTSDAGDEDFDTGADAGADTGGTLPDTGTVDTGTTATLAITSISPTSALNTTSTDIVILGEGFAPGAQVLLGADNIGVTETLVGRIRANVPNGKTPGIYDVIVTNPDGRSAILAQGFTVTEPSTDPDDDDLPPGSDDDSVGRPGGGNDGVEDGCTCRIASAPGQPGPAALLLVLAGLVLLRSRRRGALSNR
ncbi:MAG: IPT/TIG domain-containing protein, partial [Bradymonadaceae bacterium]